MVQNETNGLTTDDDTARLNWVKDLAFKHFTNLTAASVSGLFIGNFIRELYTELEKFEKELIAQKV